MVLQLKNEQKTVLITGATSGIGKAVALKFAHFGYNVILIARNEQKIKRVIHEIIHASNNVNLKYYIADLSIINEVYNIGLKIATENPIIDVLINNAGVYSANRKVTREGLELTFATNYLSPFLLTHTLFSSLCESQDSIILNVSSSAHFFGKINWNDLGIKRRWFGFRAYSQSKLLINMFTNKLSRISSGTDVRVNAIHPGVVRTNLGGIKQKKTLKQSESLMNWVLSKFGISIDQSAQAFLNIATDSKFQKVSGKYFSLDRIVRSSLKSRNKKAQMKLWDLTYEILYQMLKIDLEMRPIQVCY